MRVKPNRCTSSCWSGGLIDEDQLQKAQAEAAKTGQPLTRFLVQKDLMSEQHLVALAAAQSGVTSVDPTKPMAILNDQMVSVGDEVEGYHVLEIGTDRVLITDGTETIQLLISPSADVQGRIAAAPSVCYNHMQDMRRNTLDAALKNIREVIALCLEEKDNRAHLLDYHPQGLAFHTLTYA